MAMTEYFRKRSDFPHQAMRLSNWKKKILVMFSNGYSHRGIAEELKLSIATIQSYLKNVYEKCMFIPEPRQCQILVNSRPLGISPDGPS
jgi:DNA-binding NarL/FixJ family response regulator